MASSMNASPGTIWDRSKATEWQPATRTATGGRVCSESLGRAIFIFILFLGHYPWDPAHLVPSSIFAKDEPSVSNFAPTLRHVFSRWIRQNCWKLSSIRIQFFLFSFCNKWMEVEMKYVTIVRGEKNDCSSSRCWREISKFWSVMACIESDRNWYKHAVEGDIPVYY